MSRWSSITCVILIAVPFAMSRHIEHNSARTTARRHDMEGEDDESAGLFPKSHLRLHAKPPTVLHAKEGGSEFLECQAAGSPIPRIYWLKNGEQISNIDLADELEPKIFDDDLQDRPQKLRIGSTSSRLYLDCLTMSDDAEYSCIAENANHRESTTTRLSVSSSENTECHHKKHFGQAPRILSWTKTALENQGQDLKVICRAEGVPEPKIKWLDPREQEIDDEESNKYEILSNNDLIIRNLKWKDMGNYICLAENTHGSARAEIFVYPASSDS